MAVINHGFGFGMLTSSLSSPLIDIKRPHKSAASVFMPLLLYFSEAQMHFLQAPHWAVACSGRDVEHFLETDLKMCANSCMGSLLSSPRSRIGFGTIQNELSSGCTEFKHFFFLNKWSTGRFWCKTKKNISKLADKLLYLREKIRTVWTREKCYCIMIMWGFS